MRSGLKAPFYLLPFFLLYTLLIWLVRHTGFFWDNIMLASRHAHWYYQTNFCCLLVPETLDVGYPTTFGLLVAAAWKILGKTLPVSHFLMLPFLWGIITQVNLLVKRFLPVNWILPGMLLLLLEPTLLAQSVQVAPDVVLVFLYLLALNLILTDRRLLLSLVLFCLGILHARGVISVFSLFFTDLLWQLTQKEKLTIKGFWQQVSPYGPAGVAVLAWYYWHYRQVGWVGYNPDPNWPWHTGAQQVTFRGIGRNILLIGWRLLDFGRVTIWLVGLYLVFYFRRQPFQSNITVLRLFILFAVPLFVLSSVLVFFNNPIGHRYYLVVYILFTLFVLYQLRYLPHFFWRRLLYASMVVSLLAGHFLVYPEGIAKGWDASLAHLPYHNLRRQMLQYLDAHRIPRNQVGTAFPNLASPAITNLNADTVLFREKDLQRNTYILHSNIFNDFTDDEIAELKQHWILQKEFRQMQVYVRLYRQSKTNYK